MQQSFRPKLPKQKRLQFQSTTTRSHFIIASSNNKVYRKKNRKKSLFRSFKRSMSLSTPSSLLPSISPQVLLENTFLFFDLDGTLLPSHSIILSTGTRHTPSKQIIPTITSAPIHKMGQHGVKRVLITGRNYTSTISILENSYAELYGSDYLRFKDMTETSTNFDNSKNKTDFSLFDYIITSSGAAVSDHTFEIIEKRAISMNGMTKCVDFFHQHQYAYFLQHPIPLNHIHHYYTFDNEGPFNTKHDIMKDIHQYQTIINQHLSSLDNSTPSTSSASLTQLPVQLPKDFCVSFYNKHLDTDFKHRIEFHTADDNSFPLKFPDTIFPTPLSSSDSISPQIEPTQDQIHSHYQRLQEALEQQTGHQSISQSIVPLHRHSLLPIEQAGDFDLIFPSPPPTNNSNKSASKKIQFHSQCPCCVGSYMLYVNPQDLINHLEFNLARFFEKQHLLEFGEQVDFKQMITSIHCTSPFDHITVWYELSPSKVNKDLAAEAIIQRFYGQQLQQLQQQTSPSISLPSDTTPVNSIDQLSINLQQPSTQLVSQSQANITNTNITSPLAIFAFGNDYNDLPMLSFTNQYSTSISPNMTPISPISNSNAAIQPIFKGSYMIHTTNPTLSALCNENGFEIIGTCEDGAVGAKLGQLLEQLTNFTPETNQ